MVIHAVLAIVNVPFVTAYFTKSVPRQIVDQGRRAKRIAEISSHLGRYYHLGTILPRNEPENRRDQNVPARKLLVRCWRLRKAHHFGGIILSPCS